MKIRVSEEFVNGMRFAGHSYLSQEGLVRKYQHETGRKLEEIESVCQDYIDWVDEILKGKR